MRPSINRRIPWFERKEFTSVRPMSQLVVEYKMIAIVEKLLYRFWRENLQWNQEPPLVVTKNADGRIEVSCGLADE